MTLSKAPYRDTRKVNKAITSKILLCQERSKISLISLDALSPTPIEQMGHFFELCNSFLKNVSD